MTASNARVELDQQRTDPLLTASVPALPVAPRPQMPPASAVENQGTLTGGSDWTVQDTDSWGEATVGQLLVDTAVRAVTGAEWASITMPSDDGWTTTHGSSDLVWSFDHIQYGTGEGPCLTTASGAAAKAHSIDVAHDLRWPTFGCRVARAGVGSVLSFQLTAATAILGSLNLYGSTTHAFSKVAEQVGRMLAAQAGLLVGAARYRVNMQIALESRDVIGQAKGILMAHHKITPEQAFRQLRQASQSTNRKLRDVAEHLSATGELPQR